MYSYIRMSTHIQGVNLRILGVTPPNSSKINSVSLGPFSTIKPQNVTSSFPFMELLVCGIQQQLELLV